MKVTHVGAGSTVANVPPAVPETLTAAQAREHLRRARQRISSLLDRIDRAADEKRALREEARHLRAENERLMRLARMYQEQAGMAPGKE